MRRVLACVSLFIICTFPYTRVHAQAISEDSLRYPVLVTMDTGTNASGFYFNYDGKDLYFVTAKHVLFNQDKTTGKLSLKSSKAMLLSYPTPVAIKEPIELVVDLETLFKDGNIKAHPDKDVVVIRMTKGDRKGEFVDLSNGVAKKEGFKGSILSAGMNTAKSYDKVVPSNDVYIFGYPTSLGIKARAQIDLDKPLLRKGIVAGKNEEKRTIIIDCPSYYGNSGGPCVEVEEEANGNKKFSLIGVVTEFIPFEEQWVNTRYGIMNSQIDNSGYSVVEPIDAVLELIRA